MYGELNVAFMYVLVLELFISQFHFGSGRLRPPHAGIEYGDDGQNPSEFR